VFGPYREAPPVERAPAHRALDPWMLALLFAWVCDIGRIGLGLLGARSVTGELGFAGLLAVTTLIVSGARLRKRAS
jgi:hypothetical protein